MFFLSLYFNIVNPFFILYFCSYARVRTFYCNEYVFFDTKSTYLTHC